jgi:ribosomal protein L7/L12
MPDDERRRELARVRELATEGYTIEAIKKLRALTGASLIEARDQIEALRRKFDGPRTLY